MDVASECPALPNWDELPFATDPDEAWNTVMAAGRITRSDAGIYFLSAADLVEAAATNPDVFSSQGAFEIIGSPFPMVPLAFDRPEHTRYRRVLDKFFGPRRMAEREPELRAQVGELIETIAASGDTCEVMSQLAITFPSQVFLTLFGLPVSDRDRLIAWKDAVLQYSVAGVQQASPEVLGIAADMVDYLTGHIAERRGSRGDDLLSLLLNDPDQEPLTDQEIIGLCFLFLLAGLDTVTSATGSALYHLARDPALRQRLIADESTIPEFVEESLRVSTPIPYVPRKTTAEVEVAGVTIPADSICWLGFGAANRDSARFTDAESIQSKRQSHFAFGRGPHRCLGSHLARLELRLIIEEWNRRIPDYSLASQPTIRWPFALLHFEELNLRLG